MTYAEKILEVARSQVGVREQGGRNRGPEVDGYLLAIGLDPTKGSYAWCASFAWWTWQQAAKSLGIKNPLPRKAGVVRMWTFGAALASKTPAPGAVFCMDHGQGKGHAGLVVRVEGDTLVTIEGNGSPAGSREGDGVYERRRPVGHVNLGYLVPPP